jgi:hypothetical protein
LNELITNKNKNRKMKDTEIEKLRQIVSRNDISGNEKVEMLIIFTENYHSIQLMQTAVVGQSEQLPKKKKECTCSGMSDKVKCDFKCYD